MSQGWPRPREGSGFRVQGSGGSGCNQDDLDDVPEIARRMARPQGDHAKVLATNNWKKAVQGYLASITYTDRQIGRLLDTLDKRPDAQNTVIVLWTDHGWHLGEKLHWRKFTLWEEAGRRRR